MQADAYTPFNGQKPKSQSLKLVVTTALATVAACCAVFMLIGETNAASYNVVLTAPSTWVKQDYIDYMWAAFGKADDYSRSTSSQNTWGGI
jgi:hypothetical protein